MPENKDCALAREPFPLLDKLTIFGFATKIPDIIFGCFMAIPVKTLSSQLIISNISSTNTETIRPIKTTAEPSDRAC
jgi:hypothetical protein